MHWKNYRRSSKNMSEKRSVSSLVVETGGCVVQLRLTLDFSMKAGYRKMLQVTFSLSDEYRAGQLELIRRYNVQFRELVTGAQSAVLANSKPTKLVKIAKSYHKVRQNAIVLHNVLREKLLSETCSCQVRIIQIIEIKSLF